MFNSRRRSLIALVAAIVLSDVSMADDIVLTRSTGPFFGDSDRVSLYAHIRLEKLASTRQMALGRKLVQNVESELDRLFSRHLGFPASRIKSITWVLPSDQTPTDPNGPGVLMVQLAQPLESLKDKLKNLDWDFDKFAGYQLFTSKVGITVGFDDQQSLVIGQLREVQWLLNSSKAQERGHARFEEYRGQIVFGCNVGKTNQRQSYLIPEEVFAIVPAKRATASLLFGPGLDLEVDLEFESKLNANNGFVVLENGIGSLKKFLEGQEKEALKKFESNIGDFEFAVESLAMLTLIRQGQELLGQVKLQRSNRQVSIRGSIEGLDGNLFVISSLTAIQAIGTSAEAQFEDIAKELE